MNFFGRLAQLNRGVRRLLLTLSLVGTAVSGVSALVIALNTWPRSEQSPLVALLLVGACLAAFVGPFIGFWILVRVVLWIVDGFARASSDTDDTFSQQVKSWTGVTGIKILRVVIWIVLAASFLRGLPVFDGGRSFQLDDVGAGICFATSLIGTVLMFCLDVRRGQGS